MANFKIFSRFYINNILNYIEYLTHIRLFLLINIII
nr:MAG TPA: hypothetical protein [Caudoviricetes sp.]